MKLQMTAVEQMKWFFSLSASDLENEIKQKTGREEVYIFHNTDFNLSWPNNDILVKFT